MPQLLLFIAGLASLILFYLLIAFIAKKTKYSFIRLSFFAILIFGSIGYWGTLFIHPIGGISVAGLVGLFDTFFSRKIARQLDVDLSDLEEEAVALLMENDLPWHFVVLSISFAMFVAWLGSLIAGF